MPVAAEFGRNHLLAAMPDDELQRWLPQLECVALQAGQVLCGPGTIPSNVIFPTTAIVSLLYETESGDSAEVAVIGNEGMIGIALFMGGQSTPSRAVVRSAGRALRLSAQTVKDTFARSDSARRLMLNYTLALITQTAQMVACNRHHSVHQQLCRWILQSLDRLQGSEIVVTQELISQMLGVRRESVTEAALLLQKAGLIRYARGHISVIDRSGLEARACECYAMVREAYARLLPGNVAFDRREAERAAPPYASAARRVATSLAAAEERAPLAPVAS
jgi:CRP-like cAMP-binding protein